MQPKGGAMGQMKRIATSFGGMEKENPIELVKRVMQIWEEQDTELEFGEWCEFVLMTDVLDIHEYYVPLGSLERIDHAMKILWEEGVIITTNAGIKVSRDVVLRPTHKLKD